MGLWKRLPIALAIMIAAGATGYGQGASGDKFQISQPDGISADAHHKSLKATSKDLNTCQNHCAKKHPGSGWCKLCVMELPAYWKCEQSVSAAAKTTC